MHSCSALIVGLLKVSCRCSLENGDPELAALKVKSAAPHPLEVVVHGEASVKLGSCSEMVSPASMATLLTKVNAIAEAVLTAGLAILSLLLVKMVATIAVEDPMGALGMSSAWFRVALIVLETSSALWGVLGLVMPVMITRH